VPREGKDGIVLIRKRFRRARAGQIARGLRGHALLRCITSCVRTIDVRNGPTMPDFPNHRRSLSMIGYVTLGTNDLPRAAAFYDALLAEVGAKRLMEFPRGYVWGTSFEKPSLGVMTPYDEKPATVGNGVMVAFSVAKPEDVDRIYRKALALGAKDEGPAGPRGEGFYAGYFRDLDGNKLNVFCMG
jgi:catechol 2,3-dioxygenase-like lactoylglutathione lyase family enzyme